MRNVRNFWAETRVDGKKTVDATGPRAKEGGLEILVKIRDRGEPITAGILKCEHLDGVNRIYWVPANHGQTVLLASEER